MGSPNLATMTAQARINGWHIEPQEIELYDQVGRGGTTDIYMESWKGLQVAVKWMNPEYFHFNENSVAFFVQEIKTLSKQCHPFVLRLVGACLNPPNHGWVVTEFLSTTLKEWLHGSGNKRAKRSLPLPPLHERIAKALETTQAMQYLHGQKPRLIHRDLKPSNIFMDDARHIRVADFGHARFLSEGERAFTGETGIYVYMAPEVIRYEAYNDKCDVFSFDVMLNELITGELPYIERLWPNRGIAKGLAYLHEEFIPRIIHRDVKPTNILPDLDLNPKICDFGIARHYDDEDTQISTIVRGTMGYLDPAYYMTRQLREKADVYSYGVTVLEILCGRKVCNRAVPQNMDSVFVYSLTQFS